MLFTLGLGGANSYSSLAFLPASNEEARVMQGQYNCTGNKYLLFLITSDSIHRVVHP